MNCAAMGLFEIECDLFVKYKKLYKLFPKKKKKTLQAWGYCTEVT